MMVNPKHRVMYFFPSNSQRSSPPAAPPLDHKPPTKKAHQNTVSPTPTPTRLLTPSPEETTNEISHIYPSNQIHPTPSNPISLHLTSSNLIQPYLTSSNSIQLHPTSSHFIPLHLTPSHFISLHLTPPNFIQLHPTPSKSI